MDTQITETTEELLAETPEDVAILYSWANVSGAKYRDFSASRREYRAQVRHRAAEELREAELKAKEEAEAAAGEAERLAREAERAARSPESYDGRIDRDRVIREADEAARRAAAERVEAARRAEAAALAEAAARKEEREIAEAHASAQRQAARYVDSESRRRTAAGPQPRPAGLQSDPYEFPQGATVATELPTPNRQIEFTQAPRLRDEHSSRISGERRAVRRPEPEARRRPQGYLPDEASGMRPAYRPAPVPEPAVARPRPANSGDDFARTTPAFGSPERPSALASDRQDAPSLEADRRDERPAQREQGTPAWLTSGSSAVEKPASSSSVADTLQHSRERVAARWFALKGVFEPTQESAQEPASTRRQEVRTPALAVFSLAGGVGKTSLIATLGRALSSMGEKVLLADTTSHGLLPYYFGASELRPGTVRTFSPPRGSSDAPIHLVSYEVDQRHSDRIAQDRFAEELSASAAGTQRVLLDLNAASGWVIRRLVRMSTVVLVPVAPDMNSVISLQAVDKYFSGATDVEGRSLQPFYVINQFDATLPLHLDVREVLRRQLGDRLLPFVIRRAPMVSEALAEGMTVVDYAPDAPVADDYMNIANWLRSLSAPASPGFRNARWSER